ncbi:MAG: hypothetical protein A2Y94_04555 [Caldithrix sp. RBG_13_44_9]|nr:MAG: hypothetical protein A2Y94_04555 [Caldithrix sp. RBG_13_44_9]
MIWQIPRLRIDEEEARHRKVSWLELFYDLFFVVVIARLSHELVGDVSFHLVAEYILLFVPLWWIWIGSTYYNERFETSGLETRLMFLIKMFPLVGLAVFAHDAFKGGSTGFALSYAAGRTIITFLWLRASFHVPEFRPVGKIYVSGFTLSIVLFILSIFVSPTLRFILWGIALSIDLITPWFTLKGQSRLPRFSTSKLPERFGLLMIIVLGETAAGVVNGIQDIHSIDSEKIFTAMLGVILGFSLWWIYFDFIARRVAKPQILYSILWSYLHLPLAIGIAAIGAGLTNLISLTGETLPPNIQTLTMASYGLTLLMMGLLEITLNRTEDEPAHHFTSPILKIITGITAFGLILFLPPLHSMSLIIILIVLTLIHMMYGLWVWFGQK